MRWGEATNDAYLLAVPNDVLLEDAVVLDREASYVARNLPCRRSSPQCYRRAAAALRALASQK